MSLLTVNEVAECLRCHPNTIRSWAADGLLTVVRLGGSIRFRLADIEDFIQRSTQPAKGESV